METTVRAVRAALPLASRSRSTMLGAMFFVLGLALYVTTFVAILLVKEWPLRVFLAALEGLMVGVLFVVGHDACHGSLTPSSTLNAWLGRIAFLPALHPYSAWQYSHNALHHGWTNLRGKDPVYCPLTLEQYRQLSPADRWLERVYRTWPGLVLLYLVTIWWRLEISPAADHRAHMGKRSTFRSDRAMVIAYPVFQSLVIVSVHRAAGVSGSMWDILLCVVVPFLVFTWLIGFATFQHHTHPRVLWYRDEREWSFFRAQVQSTVHVEFPRWIELALNNIMEHTAHHIDPKVPLYRLTEAQDAVEEAFGPENVITERFSFASMSATLRKCQLYDFDDHCWLTFDGARTTSPRLLSLELR